MSVAGVGARQHLPHRVPIGVSPESGRMSPKPGGETGKQKGGGQAEERKQHVH